MSKVMQALILVLAMLFVPTQAYAAKAASGPTFTISSASDTRIDLAEVARDWSKQTDITVVVGTCTGGPYCITVAVAEVPCGDGQVSGCAATQPDGSCTATVSAYWVRDGGPAELWIAKHEVGHCIWYAGGKRSHLDDPKALMYYGFYPGVDRAVLTNADRSTSRALF